MITGCGSRDSAHCARVTALTGWVIRHATWGQRYCCTNDGSSVRQGGCSRQDRKSGHRGARLSLLHSVELDIHVDRSGDKSLAKSAVKKGGIQGREVASPVPDAPLTSHAMTSAVARFHSANRSTMKHWHSAHPFVIVASNVARIVYCVLEFLV